MPMLERTAATLEPCNIQRVLPSTSTANSFTSRRRLHTAFWQHGAADIELSKVWQIISPVSIDAPEFSSSAHSQGESVIAPTFLLDFLYPHGAATLLRKLSPSVLERYERPKNRLHTHTPRLYTSAATSQSSRTSSHVVYQSSSRDIPDTGASGTSLFAGDHTVKTKSNEAESGERHERQVIKKLRQLLHLQEPTESDLDLVWDGYHQLNPDLRPSIRPEIIVFLAHSRSPVWAARLVELFSELVPLQWAPKLVSIAIKASLRLGHEAEAILLFKQALQKQALRGEIPEESLDYLVLHTLRTTSWEVLFDIWQIVISVSPDYKFHSTSFEEFATLPGITNKLTSLYDLTGEGVEHAGSQGLHEALRTSFLNPLLRGLLPEIQSDQALSLLQSVKDPLLFEDFIPLCISRNDLELAAEAYTVYRGLPNVRIRVPIIRAMVKDVYYPNNASGMEMILGDWYKRYDRLDVFGYQQFLAFYASRGDVQSVHRMWKEYVQHYPHVIQAYSDTFTYLMHVHAVRGDISQVRKAFDEIKSLYGRKPPVECWNILLNAYAKTQDYEGALNLFDDLCKSTKPDHYSFGTIMGMSGSRGDLDTTLDLYRMSKDKGIKPTVTTVDCVIEAYCQNDAFTLAENICVMTTKQRHVQGNYTALWNTLLHHHALRQDLTTVNRLLNMMTELEVSYDDKTFDSLLKALVFCRQAHHALHLLQVAAREHAFKPTYNHYLLLMSAFIRTGEPYRAIHTHNLLTKWGFPESSDRLLRVIEALGQYRHLPSNHADEKAKHRLNLALQEFRRSLEEEKQRTESVADEIAPTSPTPHRHVVSHSSRTEQASLLIFLFSQLRDFTTVQEIIDLYRTSSPQSEDPADMPLELLSAILYSDFCENKFDKVRDTWTVIWDGARKIATPPGGKPGILPRYQYVLVDPLKTMQRMFEAEKNPDGLIELVSMVTSAGFKLDNKNWNFYVQALARLKRWREAFDICEEVLMPRWTGWYLTRRKQRVKNRLPLDLRRIGSSREYLRPIAHTMFVLAKEYGEIEQLAPWSVENGRVLSGIDEHCPRTVVAIKSMRRTGSEAEETIFSEFAGDLGGRASRRRSSPWDEDDRAPRNVEPDLQGRPREPPRRILQELSAADEQIGAPMEKKAKWSSTNDDLSADDEDFLSRGLGSSGEARPVTAKTPQYDR